MSAVDTRRLQRVIGNRAVTRILAREDGKDARPMQDAAHKADERLKSPSGHEMVWDAFDRTVTIFMPKDGPNPEGAVQIVYKEGTPEELAKMPNLGVESAVGLSTVRAQILEFLRANQGTYQQESDEAAKSARRSARRCANAFLGTVTGSLFATTLGGMNPRADAIAAGRGGAFHTLADRKEGWTRCGTPKYDPGVGQLRALGRVVVLALPLAVAGCGGSDDGIRSKTTTTGGGAATHSPAAGRDSSPDAEYGTSLTIARDLDRLYHGMVRSKVKECAVGRLVLLFEQRRGKDRALGAARSGVAPTGLNAEGQFPEKDWAVYPGPAIRLHRGARIFAEVPREERSGYVCRADRSKVLLHQITTE